ncbi:MAG: YerC/YecD family TrpR-related protein [Halanaerobiaceae bacterium]
MSKSIKNEFTDQLFAAVLQLKDIDECYRFFKDIATVAEIQELSRRLEVARMLREGATYEEIGEKTGVSTATISRVKRALEYGADGYNLILERMDETEEG